MPNWVLSLAAYWGYPWVLSALARWLHRQGAVVAAFLKYRQDGTFLEIAKAYAAATPETTDDQIVESIEQLKRDLTVVPFNRLVHENYFLALLCNVKVPDFDNDPSNDQTANNLLGKLVDETITGE